MPRETPAGRADGGAREPLAARIALLALLYALVVILLRVAEGAALSLFLGYLGTRRLPEAFLAVSLVTLPLTFLYLRFARRLPDRLLFGALLLVLAALLAGARGLMALQLGTGLFAAYLAVTALDTFIGIQWGVVALDFFTVDESRRALPLVYAGGHLGGFAAGLLLRHLARPLGTENLLFVAPTAAALLAAVLVAAAGRLREGRRWREGEQLDPLPSAGTARDTWALWRGSALLRTIAASTALMVLLRLVLRMSYGDGLSRAFPDPDDLTRFVGTYTLIATAAGVLIEVAAMPALLGRLGVGVTNVGYSLAALISLAGLAFAPGLATATAGRFADTDLKDALKSPLSALFYEGIGRERRAGARAVVLGVVSPAASLLGGLLLAATTAAALPGTTLALAALPAAGLFVVLSVLQGRAYRRALEERLAEWHRRTGGDGEPAAAATAALASGDRRAADLARALRRESRRFLDTPRPPG